MKKIFFYSLVFAFILVAVCGCVPYKRVGINNTELFVNQSVNDNFKSYNVYIHDRDNTYKVQNPSISTNSITGSLRRIESAEEVKIIKEVGRIKSKDKHRYDLNIYTKKSVPDSSDTFNRKNHVGDSASIDMFLSESMDKFELKAEDIEKVEMFTPHDKEFKIIVLYTMIGFLMVILIIWLYAAVSTTATVRDTSGSCYIATMVYGSYEAPEVMVLRDFRDAFLKKFYVGRKFIHIYYRYSPLFVEKFQHNKTVHRFCRFLLNAFVKLLSK